MDNALAIHRLHFAFTVTFHYIFPQLTMGLALLLVVLKTMALRKGDDFVEQQCRIYQKRRDILVSGLRKIGWDPLLAHERAARHAVADQIDHVRAGARAHRQLDPPLHVVRLETVRRGGRHDRAVDDPGLPSGRLD